MPDWVIIVAVIVGINVFDTWLERRFPCTCGRSRGWYYVARHVRAGVMLGRAIWATGITVLLLLSLSWIAGPLTALWSTYLWRVWWFHEKDKMQRKAAKAAGKVTLNSHGRLVVQG